MYKAGIIGCGRIGAGLKDSHITAYDDCENTELVSACDLRFAGSWDRFSGFTTYIHYPTMVQREHLDIVSVCTPPETHCQIVLDTAPFVKAIYCEKPMATTLEECDRMIETCHKHNVILQINHQRRFAKPVFRINRRASGDIINTATHAFDLLNQYGIDADIEEVMSDVSIFELKFERERMILAGVEHLVDCLDNGKQSISSGEEGREALRLSLEYDKCIQ